MRTCRKCGVEKSLERYSRYNKWSCMDCINKYQNFLYHRRFEKAITKKLLEETREFVKKVKRQGLFIDLIDAMRLISLSTDIFGCKMYNVDIESELFIHWDKINEFLENDKKTLFEKNI